MDEDELAFFRELPERITVYRGTTPVNSEDLKVFSWSLYKDTAEWYAQRFNTLDDNDDGDDYDDDEDCEDCEDCEDDEDYEDYEDYQHIFQAELPKDGVLACFREGKEIIADPEKLENIRQIK